MRREVDTTSSAATRHKFWTLTALVAVAWLVHARALRVPFVYDDMRTVVGNPSLVPPLDLGFVLSFERFRPLTNLSYALDRSVWGLEPIGFHLTSLLLHGANVALLFAWASGLGRGRARAARCAALFAVHPALTQAVGYVTGRAELLCATGVLVAVLAHQRLHLTGRARWVALLVVAWGMALAAKETAAALPVVFLVLDRVGPRPLDRWRPSALPVGMLGLVAFAGVGRLASHLGHGGSPIRGLTEHVMTVPIAAAEYARLVLAPVEQTIVHGVPSTSGAGALVAALMLAAGVGLAWAVRRRTPLAFVGAMWFVAFLVPALALPLEEPVAEQRLYLPAIGLLLALSDLVPSARSALAPALVVGALSALTAVRYEVWSDPWALWTEALTRDPRVAIAWTNRGVLAYELGDRAAARADLDRALIIQPLDPVARTNRASILADVGDLAAALADVEFVLERSPRYANALVVRSRLRGVMGDLAGAAADASAALAENPFHVFALNNRAKALRGLGRDRAALADYDAALRLAPSFFTARVGRARTRAAIGDVRGALDDLDAALALDPTDPTALADRARLRHAVGDHLGARADASRALDCAQRRGASQELFGELRALSRLVNDAPARAPDAPRSP